MARCNYFIALLPLCLILAGCSNKPTAIAALTDAQSDSQLGLRLIETHQIAAARAKLTQGIIASSKASSPWYTLGYLEEVVGNNTAANADFRKAIALSPQSGPAHNNYGTFLCHRGKFNAALTQFAIAVKEPKYYDLSAAYENAGLCSLENGKQDTAKSYFLAAVGAAPYMPHSLFELAFIFYNEKNFGQSQYYLDQYLSMIQTPGAKSKQLRAYLKMKKHPALLQFLPEPIIES
ncbi:MAG: hypothetical protein COB66_08280 [Coxiella sp. (in: Bacteria)]|nr:MAG: hypothetical protein COB66_08280 [Coxiella sp. (in: g-proteobacteria)]